MLRWTIRIAVFAALALGAYVAVTFVQVWQASHRDQARKVQAIVVLGAAQYNGRPSPVLRARLDHAVHLYRRGDAPTIVVTGGRQPGDTYTEARVSADYLIERGVPDSAILREVQGRNSWESLQAAAGILEDRDIRVVLLVSDPFHSERVSAIADELGLLGYVSPTRTSPIHGMRSLPYLAKETVAVAIGRLVGFRRGAGIDSKLHRVRPSVSTG